MTVVGKEVFKYFLREYSILELYELINIYYKENMFSIEITLKIIEEKLNV
jgi:hypothetical protein